MRLADPYAIKIKPSRETVIFAAGQLLGQQPTQEDYFLNFNDECFVLADGVGSMPNGEVASKFACETAIWAYKHIRQHRYYWQDKKLFMKRIFRSTNLAVWQKQREKGFEDGLATSLMVLIVGAKQYWLGCAGPSDAWFFHGSVMTKLTPEIHTFSDVHRDVLGIRRLGLTPIYKTGALSSSDVLIMTSTGCGNYVTPMDLQTCVATVGETTESISLAATSLLSASTINGSKENMTTLIVKRVE